jgi:hypothetical protein
MILWLAQDPETGPGFDAATGRRSLVAADLDVPVRSVEHLVQLWFPSGSHVDQRTTKQDG